MGSTRLPGKSMLPLCGKPMLQHIVERVQRATKLDDVCVATPHTDADLKMVEQLQPHLPLKTEWFSCSNPETDPQGNDLVGRYLEAAEHCGADIIVRVCADNPCIQPKFIDQAIDSYMARPQLFVSTTVVEYKPGLFIDGLGAEVFSLSRLKWLDRATQGQPFYREHPHKLFEDQHLIDSWERYQRRGRMTETLRLDVNTQADYEFIRDIYEHVYPAHPQFTIDDVLAYLERKR